MTNGHHNDSASLSELRDTERQRVLVALAAAGIAESVFEVLQEALREGVDLPEGFVVRTADVISRRAVPALERLARTAAKRT